MSMNVPYHPLNAWSSPVRGQVNGFVHGGYQVSSALPASVVFGPHSG